jgi:hypothetical protein
MVIPLDTKTQRNIALFVNTGRESFSDRNELDEKLKKLKEGGISQVIIANIWDESPEKIDLIFRWRLVDAIGMYISQQANEEGVLHVPTYINGKYNRVLNEELPEEIYIFLNTWFNTHEKEKFECLKRCSRFHRKMCDWRRFKQNESHIMKVVEIEKKIRSSINQRKAFLALYKEFKNKNLFNLKANTEDFAITKKQEYTQTKIKEIFWGDNTVVVQLLDHRKKPQKSKKEIDKDVDPDMERILAQRELEIQKKWVDAFINPSEVDEYGNNAKLRDDLYRKLLLLEGTSDSIVIRKALKKLGVVFSKSKVNLTIFGNGVHAILDGKNMIDSIKYPRISSESHEDSIMPTELEAWWKKLEQYLASTIKQLDQWDVQKNIAEHKGNLLYEGEISLEWRYIDSWTIEDNLLYHAPHIVAYLYRFLWDEAKDIIFAIAQFWSSFTGKRFLDTDWGNITELPKDILQELINAKSLDEKFEKFLLGQIFFNKWKRAEKLSYGTVARLLERSSIFRKKVLKNMGKLLYLMEAEVIREMIQSTFEKLPNINGVSDRSWVEYLLSKTRKNIEELEWKNKEKNKDAIKNEKAFLAELESIDIRTLSDKAYPLIDNEICEGHKKKVEHLKTVTDIPSLVRFEYVIIQNTLFDVTRRRIESSEDDPKNGIPLYFHRNWEYTCFSGNWLLASMLLKAGIPQDRIFFMDSQSRFDGMAWEHAYLMIKLSDGSFVKVDYMNNWIETVHPNDWNVTKSSEKWLSYGLDKSYIRFREWSIDNKSRMYRLVDGISLIYIRNFAWHLYNSWEYEKCMNIAQSGLYFSHNEPTLCEYIGLCKEKLWDPTGAHEYYELAGKQSLTATFKKAEKFLQGWNIVEARKYFVLFQIKIKKAWWVSDIYRLQCDKYLSELWAIQENESLQLILFLSDMHSKGIIEVSDVVTQYMKIPELFRPQILQELTKRNEWNDTILTWVLVREEKQEETKIWTTIKFTAHVT